MTTPANPIVIDFDGRNAFVSDVSAHLDTEERVFVEVKDAIFRANRRIQKRNGKTIIGSSAGARITAMHAFTYYDASGVPSYVKYRTHGTIIGATTGTVWSAMTLPYTPTSGAPWVFANHAGRVFAVNSKEALIVSAGQPGDAWREVGQVAPLVAPAVSLTASDPPVTNSSTGTTVSATKGSLLVNNSGTAFVTGSAWVGKRYVIDGRAYTIAAVGATNQLTLTEQFKEETAAGLSWSVYPGVGDWVEGPQYAFAFYNPTTGHISNISPIFQVVEKNQFGRTITVTIAGSAAINAAYNAGYTEIQLFRTPLNGAQLVALNEKLASNNTTTNITYVETATKFADTYLTKLPADQIMRRKPVTDASYQITGATNATPIVITTSASTQLITGQIAYVTNVGGNTAANGTWVVTVLSPTTFSLNGSVGSGAYTSGGTAAASIPVRFLAIASYKGRLWGITRNRIYWSASLDEVPFWQVPEECWPAQFSREINEAFGLVVIGQEGYNDRLVIQTAEGDYTVEGYDNRDIEVFPLRRRPSGGFLGGATVADGRLVELYRDRRLLDQEFGDIAAPIQNRLNDISASLTTACRIHWFALNQRDYVAVSLPGSSASVDVDTLLVYDYTLQRWQEAIITPGVSAFATVKDANGSLELWVGDTSGAVWRISDPSVWQDNGVSYAPSVKTCVLRFGYRVALAHVQMFVSDASQTWNIKTFLDEQTSEAAGAIADKSFQSRPFSVARHQNQSAQGRELEYVPTTSDRATATTFQFTIVFASTNTDLWFEKLRFTFNGLEPAGQA